MTRREDMGMRVARLARQITPDQMAELLALRLANMHETQIPTAPYHWLPGTPQAELLAERVITAEIVPGWSMRGWRRGRLTELGERVLLHIAEECMLAQGRMAAPAECAAKAEAWGL